MNKIVMTEHDAMELIGLIEADDFAALENVQVKPTTTYSPKRWNRMLPDEYKMLITQMGPVSGITAGVILVTPRIRRKSRRHKALERFFHLWENYADVLLKELDTRWLVSSCDTFVDHGRNELEKSWGISTSLLLNTIKLYETELLRLAEYPDLADPEIRLDTKALNEKHGRTIMFDGVTRYKVNGGDMPTGIRKRIEGTESNTIPFQILKEVYRRVHTFDTIYKRVEDFNQSRQKDDTQG